VQDESLARNVSYFCVGNYDTFINKIIFEHNNQRLSCTVGLRMEHAFELIKQNVRIRKYRLWKKRGKVSWMKEVRTDSSLLIGLVWLLASAWINESNITIIITAKNYEAVLCWALLGLFICNENIFILLHSMDQAFCLFRLHTASRHF
jgi:hypothetical protein